MKRCLILLLLVLVSLLYSGKGKIGVAANERGAYIYVNGKKKAMTGEGFTTILLAEGEYTIKAIKPIDKYTAYVAEKKVFVGEDTFTKINFTLRREVLILKTIWSKTFGGKSVDIANSIIQSKDGGFVVAGETRSKGMGDNDVWIVKLDKDGNRVWDKTFGGDNSDSANSIIQSKDGGFIVAGYTKSKGAGGFDAWILKLDKDGNKVWDKTFGGGGFDDANSIIQSSDGGFVVAGYTETKDVGGIWFGKDIWILKLGKDGNRVWDKTFGGKNWDEAKSIIQSKDGGFIVAGYTKSKGADGFDAWILKLDKDGNRVWDKTFGGSGFDGADSIIQSNDGGFVVAGYTGSKGAGKLDTWILKLDKDGNRVWDKIFGGSSWDGANSIIQSYDGGFIVAGYTGSKDAGKKDAWILKLDKDGNRVWDKIFGRKNKWDEANSIILSKDGGFVVAGITEPKDVDMNEWVLGLHGVYDVWVFKLLEKR